MPKPPLFIFLGEVGVSGQAVFANLGVILLSWQFSIIRSHHTLELDTIKFIDSLPISQEYLPKHGIVTDSSKKLLSDVLKEGHSPNQIFGNDYLGIQAKNELLQALISG